MGRLRYIRLSGRQRLAIWSALIVLVLTTVVCMAVIHMEPILVSMATARVSNTVNRIVVEAVNDAIQGGEIDYGILVEFEKDAEGRVTALKSNMAAFNRLQSRIADDILLRLSEVSTTTLAIPIGTLTGSSLLAGRGPALKVKMQSVGSTTASFRNTFGSAGINQTRHQILLDVQVNMSILLPGFRTSTKVNNEISVAETVIVGSVPENYTYFSTSPNEIDDYAEDYILNNG
ncbi:MAG: sporulation protein YunB [Oscillospiraceae bacterium]|nr:sporulation protein YunB [Oscillospiraceae bacterium]